MNEENAIEKYCNMKQKISELASELLYHIEDQENDAFWNIRKQKALNILAMVECNDKS